nr:hypothetical protein [Rhodobacter capsulatus]
MAGERAGLFEHDPAQGVALSGLARADHPFQRLLVAGDQRAPTGGEDAQAVALRLEHLGAQAAAVEEAHRQPLGEGGAEHLHQVIDGGVAPVLRLMQHAKAGVQPRADQRRADVAGQKRGQVIDRGVEGRFRRTFAQERPLVRGAEPRQRGPVDPGGPPLMAAQAVQIGHRRGKAPDRAAKGGDGAVHLGRLGGAVEHGKPRALVAQPRPDQNPRQRQTPFGMQHKRGLCQLQLRLGGLRRGKIALGLAMAIEKGKRGVGGQRMTPDRVIDHGAGAQFDPVHPRGRQRQKQTAAAIKHGETFGAQAQAAFRLDQIEHPGARIIARRHRFGRGRVGLGQFAHHGAGVRVGLVGGGQHERADEKLAQKLKAAIEPDHPRLARDHAQAVTGDELLGERAGFLGPGLAAGEDDEIIGKAHDPGSAAVETVVEPVEEEVGHPLLRRTFSNAKVRACGSEIWPNRPENRLSSLEIMPDPCGIREKTR